MEQKDRAKRIHPSSTIKSSKRNSHEATGRIHEASLKQKTECRIRTLSASIGFVMSLGGVAALLLDKFASGLVLCIFAIIFVAMAIGYRYIELVMNKVGVKLKL